MTSIAKTKKLNTGFELNIKKILKPKHPQSQTRNFMKYPLVKKELIWKT